MRSLLYMYDPLCGLRYAAEPWIPQLRAAGVTVDLNSGQRITRTGGPHASYLQLPLKDDRY